MALTIGELVGYLTLDSKGFDQGVGKAQGTLSGFGQGIGKFVGATGAAIGAVGGLLGGLAIQGGISRALQIEDAQAKLKGLGHDTDTVTSIMKNATAAVKGTAFGLGEAATASAGAVAAGIKPGQQLEKVLKLVADSATIAGTDMASMGSIFNKVAASGKLQGDVINQLQDAGVPVLQFVAKQMGVTAGEAADLASKGKVSFEIFSDAMQQGLGGAAAKSGETFRGALKNTRAALSRIGETLVLPFIAASKAILNAVMPIFDGLNNALKPFAADLAPKVAAAAASMASGLEAFSSRASAAIGTVSEFFTKFVDTIRGSAENLSGILLPAIGGIMGAFGPLMTKLPLLGPMFKNITGPVGLFVGAIAGLIAASPELRSALGGAFEQIVPVIGMLVGAFAPLLGVIAQLAEPLGNLIAAVIPALSGVITVLGTAIAGVVFGISTAISWFSNLNGGSQALAAGIAALVVGLVAYNAVMKAQAAWTAIVTAATAVWNAVQAANPVGLVILAIAALIAIIVLLVSNWDTVVAFITDVWNGFIGWFTGVMDGFFGWWNQMWAGLFGFATDVWNGFVGWVQGIWNGFVSWIMAVLIGYYSWWQSIWNSIGQTISDVWN